MLEQFHAMTKSSKGPVMVVGVSKMELSKFNLLIFIFEMGTKSHLYICRIYIIGQWPLTGQTLSSQRIAVYVKRYWEEGNEIWSKLRIVEELFELDRFLQNLAYVAFSALVSSRSHAMTVPSGFMSGRISTLSWLRMNYCDWGLIGSRAGLFHVRLYMESEVTPDPLTLNFPMSVWA